MGKLGYKSKYSTNEIPSFERLKILALQDNNELENEINWMKKFFGTELVKIEKINLQAPQEWCDEQSFITDIKPINRIEKELDKLEVDYLNLTNCFMDNYSFYQTNDKDKWILEMINSQPSVTQVDDMKSKSTNTTRVKINKLEI
ncbi:hypothetical protein [Mycoplasmopsis verecunda]|uniref:Uncharacterized protein n=1 Tax=Mycoplasmopsis verecunda TaxID=171291 RepID=A0A1T4LJG5_9BACT|nr:hypothetical protein [Mycoplasmopsis verecunda]WPB54417.1 hypothetical protein SAM46_02925 [Mycoplasmopsis verecunda]SJZ54698.1 hypothetical protein SAMN02745154_00465 [Mycoplasmopsis verecunda]